MSVLIISRFINVKHSDISTLIPSYIQYYVTTQVIYHLCQIYSFSILYFSIWK